MCFRYDAYVEKQRLYAVEDPDIPWILRSGIRTVWDLMAPHFRDEVCMFVPSSNLFLSLPTLFLFLFRHTYVNINIYI